MILRVNKHCTDVWYIDIMKLRSAFQPALVSFLLGGLCNIEEAERRSVERFSIIQASSTKLI